MRQVFFVVAFLLSAAVPSFAQEQLKVGNSYSGAIKVSSANSGIYVPLPEGNWVLTSLEETRGRNANSPLLSGRLLSTDQQKRVVGVVAFSAGNDSVGGWETPSYCSRKDTFFLHKEVQRRGRGLHCWGVHPTGMAAPTANAANYVRDFYQWVSKNGYKLPQTMIIVNIYRSSGPKYLYAAYYRNPELDGFRRSAASTWQKDVVVGDEKKLKYLENAKAWGDQWQPTIEDALAGRLK